MVITVKELREQMVKIGKDDFNTENACCNSDKKQL